jgi:hypothetical protein
MVEDSGHLSKALYMKESEMQYNKAFQRNRRFSMENKTFLKLSVFYSERKKRVLHSIKKYIENNNKTK